MADPELSLGGHSLLFDATHQAWDFLRKYQPLQDLIAQVDESLHRVSSRDSSVGLSTIGIAKPNYPDPPPPRINQLYWPTGASRWARGYFLAGEGVATSLAGSCGSPLTLKAVVSDMTFEAKVYALPPHPVSCVEPSGSEAIENLYLIPVVDRRYWWQFRSMGGKGFCIEGKPTDTWSQLFQSFALGVSIILDSIPSEYLKPDPNEFTRRFDNAATILDAAAHSVGMRIVFQFDETLKLINWDNSKSEYANNLVQRTPWWQIAGNEEENKPVPASVDVAFPNLLCGIPDCNRRHYNRSITFGGSKCTTSGTQKTVYSTAWANYIPNNGDWSNLVLKNETELNTLAQKTADDYYDSLDKVYDYTFNGLKSWYLTGYDDHVLISFGTEDEPGLLDPVTTVSRSSLGSVPDADTEIRQTYERGYFTRIQSMPLNHGVDQMLHQGNEEPLVPEGTLAMKAFECIKPGRYGDAILMRFTGEATSGQWIDTECRFRVFDPFYRNMILPGEQFFVRRDCTCGVLQRFDIVGENGLFRKALTLADIDCFSQGPALIAFHNSEGTCSANLSACLVTVCNDWGHPRKLNEGDEIKIRFLERRWVVIHEPRATQALAILGQKMCPEDQQVAISDFEGMDGCISQQKQPTTADNYLKLSGKQGAKLYLKYRQSNDTWIVVQVEHEEFCMVGEPSSQQGGQQGGQQGACKPIDIKQCKFNIKTQKFSAMTCRDPDDYDLTMDKIKVMDAAFLQCDFEESANDCDIKIKLHQLERQICAFSVGQPSWADSTCTIPMTKVNLLGTVAPSCSVDTDPCMLRIGVTNTEYEVCVFGTPQANVLPLNECLLPMDLTTVVDSVVVQCSAVGAPLSGSGTGTCSLSVVVSGTTRKLCAFDAGVGTPFEDECILYGQPVVVQTGTYQCGTNICCDYTTIWSMCPEEDPLTGVVCVPGDVCPPASG